MVTRVNMAEVRDFRDDTRALCREVRSDLQAIRRSLEAMGQMRGFSGQAADQTKRYVRTFHLTIVKTFDSLFTDLLVKLNQDIQAFHGEVDTASRTQLNRNALLELRADIQDDYRQLYSGYERVRESLLKVADISGVKVPAIKTASQDQRGTRDHISEVLDDLSGFDRRKKHSQIEQVLNQLRKTLNQTKKMSAPLRGGHYQQLVSQGALEEFNIYTHTVGRNPETRYVHGQLDALGIRPDPIPFKVFSRQGIEALLAKGDQVQLVETYVSQELWGDFINILKAAAPSYKAMGLAFWEGAQTRQNEMFDSVGSFVNWFTFGMFKGVLDANQANYKAMRDTTNAYTVTNWLTLGIPDMVVGAFNPENPLSAEHLLDSFGVVSMIYGGAAAAKHVRGVATVKPLTALNTPIQAGPIGKPLFGQGGKLNALALWKKIRENIGLSKRARQASNFKGHVKREQVVLNGGGKTGVGKSLTLEQFLKEMDELPRARLAKKVEDGLVSLPNGERLSPSVYMSKAEIDVHLSLFDQGAVKIQSKEAYFNAVQRYGGSIGDPKTGTYVLPKNVVDKAILVSDGNPRILENLLGLETGYLGEKPVLLDFNKIDGLRVPTGNEAGAWQGYWIPSGYTNNGIPEAVINQVSAGGYKVIDIFK